MMLTIQTTFKRPFGRVFYPRSGRGFEVVLRELVLELAVLIGRARRELIPHLLGHAVLERARLPVVTRGLVAATLRAALRAALLTATSADLVARDIDAVHAVVVVELTGHFRALSPLVEDDAARALADAVERVLPRALREHDARDVRRDGDRHETRHVRDRRQLGEYAVLLQLADS